MSVGQRTGWFAAQGHIVGTADAWEITYSWDGSVFSSREEAQQHGFRAFGSDDFNIGHLRDDRLVWWGWMDQELPRNNRAAVATALGLQP